MDSGSKTVWLTLPTYVMECRLLLRVGHIVNIVNIDNLKSL